PILPGVSDQPSVSHASRQQEQSGEEQHRAQQQHRPEQQRPAVNGGDQHHSCSLFFGGRPRRTGSAGAILIPRRASASRSSISISALTERNSCAATRSTAAWSAGSRRRAKAFFGACGTAPASLIERA